MDSVTTDIESSEHWVQKGEVRLFLWRKTPAASASRRTLVFVHGSSMAGQPTFDLQVPGRADSSGEINADISNGADDLTAGVDHIRATAGVETVDLYGISSGALRAALFAERQPNWVGRLVLDAFVWTGEGSPTLVDRRKKLPEFKANLRRPINLDFVRSIFSRDHPGCAEDSVVEAFAEAITALDDSVPNGTYVDMCERLPLVDPAKITAACMILRGQWDGIAGFDDLIEFFKLLPNPDKQFKVMAGISHASFQQKNYLMAYQMLYDFLAQPEPVYLG